MRDRKRSFFAVFTALFLISLAIPALASDVKFFGDYYVYGVYENDHSLKGGSPSNDPTGVNAFGQRLRVNTVFQVAEGLKLTTRFDALERMWGKEQSPPNRYIGGNGNLYNSNGAGVSSTAGPNFIELDQQEKNISFERAYVTFNLGPGFFDVGYQADGFWSPIVFGNTAGSAGPMIRYTAVLGSVTLGAYYEKGAEQTDALGQTAQYVSSPQFAYSGGDKTVYALQGTFKWKSGQTGLQVLYNDDERMNGEYQWMKESNPSGTTTFSNASVRYWEISPFVQAKIGIVDLEGKLYWNRGEIEYRATPGLDKDIEGLSAYASGKVNIGPAYVGVMYAYIQGDNDQRAFTNAGHQKIKQGRGGGQDWDPTLMLGNDRFNKWTSQYKNTLKGYASDPFVSGYHEKNVRFIQGFVGYSPIPTLQLRAAFTNATLDYTVNASNSKDLGNELDLVAIYKIYTNLDYMLGLGYLFTGDYFKGNASSNPRGYDVHDDLMLMHQLTLTF